MDENTNLQSDEKKLALNKKIFQKYINFFVVVILISASFYMGFQQGQEQNSALVEKNVPLNSALVENKFSDTDKNIDFSLFWKVWDLVKDKHIKKNELNAQELVYGAINGMLRATGDPYSTFFNPKESKSFSQDIEGSFEGIGAELGIKDDILTVIAPLEGSPAEKAGLRAGDKIIKINDRVTTDLSTEQSVDLIRGKKGTEVVLTILHSGEDEAREVTVARDTIEVISVKLETKENGIAYLKINKFSENTLKEFNTVMNQIVTQNSSGIVLDLRNNPGGLLDQAVAIASRMIPRNKVVVTQEDSSGKKESISTTGGDKLSGIPTVILINEGSASASEILAGALHDNLGTTLIGQKSFGKGTVQQLMELPGGSSVKITIAKWLTPNGEHISEKGIDPDVSVEITLDDYTNNRDPQLDKAMEILSERIKN